MKSQIIASLALISLIGGASAAHAQPGCQNFGGTFENTKDPAQPTVILTQRGCSSEITLLVNDGTEWKIDLSGAPTPLPAKFATGMISNFFKDTYYEARLSPKRSYEVNIKAYGRLAIGSDDSILGPRKIGMEFVYEATAYLESSTKAPQKIIQLVTQSIRLVSVDPQNVENGEVSGFKQGANLILALFKSRLDARLVSSN